MRVIEVVPYNPQWIEQYRQEAQRLREVFGDLLLEIHHIGSTSIPGMSAKPTIDIMPILRDIQRVDEFVPAMAALHYIDRGEFGIPGRRFFLKPSEDLRTHHVHAYQPGNPEIQRHFNFRDYLIAHPEDALAYAQLKQELAVEFRYDAQGYVNGKSAFIQGILRKAEQWRANGSPPPD